MLIDSHFYETISIIKCQESISLACFHERTTVAHLPFNKFTSEKNIFCDHKLVSQLWTLKRNIVIIIFTVLQCLIYFWINLSSFYDSHHFKVYIL